MVLSVKKRRVMLVMGLGFCSAISAVCTASAQMPLPAAKPPDGPALFKQQCGACHATDPSEPFRQGPPLDKVLGRQAGTVNGFHYSPAFAKADFVWDENKLDAWLSDPQAVIPGAAMAYRQAKPETRAAIIAYLRGLN
jgi:cytochrome c